MDRSAIIIQGVLLFFLIFGLFLVVVPENVNQLERRVYRAFRLISDEAVKRPLSARSVLVNRVMGMVYVVGTIIILLNLHLQVGRISSQSVPVWTSSALVAQADSALHEKIRDIVTPAMHQHVGLVVATIAEGARDISGFGRVSLDSEQPPDGDTIFEIGSISKVFTGLLLADSVLKKKLTLDTPMVALLPSVSTDADSRTNRITLQHLVTHTSGLPRSADNPFNPVHFWRVITAGDPYRDYKDATILQAISRNQPSFSPGERYSYSNVGFGVLGLVVSEQSGMDYHQAVKTVIAQPLAMSSTGVVLDQAQRARLAQGHRTYLQIGSFYLTQLAAPWEFPNSVAGAGGLRSTANDMMVFLAANMGRQQSDLAPALQESHKILFSKDDTQIGMAWFYDPLPKSGQHVIWHNGETGGYTGYIGFTDDNRFGVVVLGNSTQNVDDLGRKILDQLILRQ